MINIIFIHITPSIKFLYTGCHQAENIQQTITILSSCRNDCSIFYKKQNKSLHDLPEIIQSFGGLDDFLEHPFGFKLPVCSIREGYSFPAVSHQQIDFKMFIEEMVSLVPAFTKKGFNKMKIPAKLHHKLLQFRNDALTNNAIKAESHDFGVINGPTVIENKETQKSREMVVNRTQLIELDKVRDN